MSELNVNATGKFDPLIVTVDLAGVAATTGGAVASVANPFGFAVWILFGAFRSTTQATGTPTVDIGIGATATTSSDTLFDGLAVGTAAKVASTDVANGTNGTGAVYWAADTFLTVTGSATTANLVAQLRLVCMPA